MKPRINIFEQLQSYYSFVFENQDKVRQSHTALYAFLLNQNNRNNWSEWFKCPFDLAMAGACIGSKSTYYKCLNDLQDWKLIKWRKGENSFKAPQICILVLSKSEPLTVPLSEPLHEPLTVPLSEQLSVLLTGKKERLITDNYTLITNNIKKWIVSELENSSTVFDFKKSLLSLGIQKSIVEDWIKIRKSKKAVNSETAFNLITKEINKTNLSANDCISECVMRSWSGFKAEWINKQQNNFNNGTTTQPRRTLDDQVNDLTARVLGINTEQSTGTTNSGGGIEEADFSVLE
jgi:hypothetical protein